jgi:hypothetical protein
MGVPSASAASKIGQYFWLSVYSALYFLRRPRGILRRDGGHADEAVGVAAAGQAELIVGIGGQALGFIGGEDMGAGGAMRRSARSCNRSMMVVARTEGEPE